MIEDKQEKAKLIEAIKFGLEIAGFVMVIMQLFFLTDELKQNSEINEAQVKIAISNSLLDVSLAFADKDISTAFSKPINELTPTECNQLYGFARGMFRSWENQYYQHELGYFSADGFEGAKRSWVQLLNWDIFRLLWDRQKNGYSSKFKEEIDREVKKIQKKSPIQQIKLPPKSKYISLCHPQPMVHSPS